MNKARGSRGVREVSEEQYSHTLQQKFNQAMGVTPKWANLHQPVKDEEEELLVKVGVEKAFHLEWKLIQVFLFIFALLVCPRSIRIFCLPR